MKKAVKKAVFTTDGMGYICRHCGAGNFSSYATKCVHCEEPLHEEIGFDEGLTAMQLTTLYIATRRHHLHRLHHPTI